MKSTLSVLIIASYILCCLRLRARPWNYFQINSKYFCRQRGIFSKMALDQMIPLKWRLHQQRLDDACMPETFPVFLKPEWGQNSVGIERADNEHQFRTLSRRVKSGPVQYLVQHAAPEAREFEIFTTFTDEGSQQPDYLSVTETVNTTHRYPINGINNEDSRYRDITNTLTPLELTKISGYVREIGHFGQSRLSVRADTIEQLINGDFHIIEINLFTPMPIHLMDDKHSIINKIRSALSVSVSLARVTRAMGHIPNAPAVFIRMTVYGRKHHAAQQAVRESARNTARNTARNIRLAQSGHSAAPSAKLQSANKNGGSAVNIHCS